MIKKFIPLALVLMLAACAGTQSADQNRHICCSHCQHESCLHCKDCKCGCKDEAEKSMHGKLCPKKH